MVEEGKVRFGVKFGAQQCQMQLTAQQSATYDGQMLGKQGKGNVKFDMANQRIIFDAPLQEVADFIADLEGMHIHIGSEALANKQVVVTQPIPFEGGAHLMQLLSISLGAQAKIENSQISIE
jgi:hypothetical protein